MKFSDTDEASRWTMILIDGVGEGRGQLQPLVEFMTGHPAGHRQFVVQPGPPSQTFIKEKVNTNGTLTMKKMKWKGKDLTGVDSSIAADWATSRSS
jgi:hypothetical protein